MPPQHMLIFVGNNGCANDGDDSRKLINKITEENEQRQPNNYILPIPCCSCPPSMETTKSVVPSVRIVWVFMNPLLLTRQLLAFVAR
jgi:hypothetical protein